MSSDAEILHQMERFRAQLTDLAMSAQNSAAMALLSGPADLVLATAADDNLLEMQEQAGKLLESLIELSEGEDAEEDPFEEELASESAHQLYHLASSSFSAVSEAGDMTRERLVAALTARGKAQMYAVSLRLHMETPDDETAEMLTDDVRRSREIDDDSEVEVAEVHQYMREVVVELLGDLVVIPGEHEDESLLVEFDGERHATVAFRMACDGQERADVWARLIADNLIDEHVFGDDVCEVTVQQEDLA